MVRDKVGSSKTRGQLNRWLNDWIGGYVDGSPSTSSEEFKAAHPLRSAKVLVDEKPNAPGQYEAKFLITPHYQLEGASVMLRLTSKVTPG